LLLQLSAAHGYMISTTRETDMTLNEIYDQYTPGSQGFVDAVETHCGFDISRSEIERIADKSPTAADFQRNWEGDDSWTDAANEQNA
jgi:hypothetical protein